MNGTGKINWILIVVLLTVILALLTILAANMDAGQPADPGQPPATTESTPQQTLEILSIVEDNEQVTVTTNVCVVKYPYAFSDLVRVEAVNTDEKTALLFAANLDGVKIK